MKNKYDIIIVGGGTAGCACAYTSGKLGMSTLLIEKNSFLGGAMTSALVTPAMNTKTDKKLNYDFYELLMKNLHDIGGQITYPDGNIGWFNPELMKIILDKMMNDAGVDILFDTEIADVIRSKGQIKGVLLDEYYHKNLINNETIYDNNIVNKDKMLSEFIETKYLVDGTGDAKIFEKLNLEFLDNFEKNNEKKFQPNSLRFMMSGINIKEFSEWIMELDPNRDVTTSYTVDGETHISTAYTWDKGKNWALEPVFRSGIEEGLITNDDSNYFQLFSIPKMPATIGFNCPRIHTETPFNPLNIIERSRALKQGREAIYRLSNFMIKKFKGFEKAYISSIANSLGVRVSNRIKGKYVYTIDDLRSGKRFDNPVLVSKYPVDVHSSKQGKSVLEKQEVEYMLPVESLLSCDYNNLYAIGRCISADFLSQGALRIIPSCFAMGEGLAKYIKNTL